MKKNMIISIIMLLLFGIVSAYSVENEDKVDKSSYIKIKGKANAELFYSFFMNLYEGGGCYIMIESSTEKQVLFFNNVLQGKVKIKKNEEVTIYGVCESLSLMHPYVVYCDVDISHCTKIVELNLQNIRGDSIHISNNNRIHYLRLLEVSMNKVNVDNCDSLKELTIRYGGNPNASYSSIKLSNLEKLEKLVLERIAISDLRINNVPKVTELDLSNRNMSYFEYKGGKELSSLTLNNNNLKDCIVEGSPRLKTLSIQNNRLEKLSVAMLDSLTILNVINNRLEELDLAKMPLLYFLNVMHNDIPTLDIIKLKYLKELYVDSNKRINDIDLSNSRLLERVYCSGLSEIETLDLSNLQYLQMVRACDNKKLKSIDLSNSMKLSKAIINSNPELKSISGKKLYYLTTLYVCDNPLLTTLDLSKSYALDTLVVEKCSIEELDLSASSFLKLLSAKHNKLKKINLGNSKVLETIDLRDNELTEIDLTNNRLLTFVNLSDNKLSSLNVDNLPYLLVLKIQGNRFTAQAYDDLYCQLCYSPRDKDNMHMYSKLFLLKQGDDPNAPIVFQSNVKNILKNLWYVSYAIPGKDYEYREFIPDSLFTGTYKCNYNNINLDNKIVLTGKIGDEVKVGILPEEDNTEIKMQIGNDAQEYKCNSRWLVYHINFTDSVATFYGNISALRLHFEESELHPGSNRLEALDASNHSSLKDIYCPQNKMKRLNVRNSKQLRLLNALNNSLEELDLSTNKNLIDVNVGLNNIKKLDLSDNIYLRKLSCIGAVKLKELNIKGDYSLDTIDISFTTLSPEELDKIYCDVYGNNGIVYACESQNDFNYKNIMASSSKILTDKKWKLLQKEGNLQITTNGTNTCPNDDKEMNRYPLFVGGITVNDKNKDNITAPGITGKISYDPETNTLRMENATISEPWLNFYTISYFIYPMYHHYYYAYYYMVCDTSNRDFTIELIGDNKIILRNDWDRSYTTIAPIYGNRNLIFKGGGKLSFQIKDARYDGNRDPRYNGDFAAIYANRKLIIDSCEIEFKSNVGLHALYSNDSLIFKNNARYKAETKAAAIVTKFDYEVYSKYKLYDGAVIFEGLNEEVNEPVSSFKYFWLRRRYFIYGTMPYISIVPGWASVRTDDKNKQADYSIFPNPASDFININLKPQHIGKELIILNILGEVKYRTTLYTNELRIPLNAFAKGMYIIQIGDERRKLVIQ